MQYHLANPIILYFDIEGEINATFSRKKSWKDLYQNVNKGLHIRISNGFFFFLRKLFSVSVFCMCVYF